MTVKATAALLLVTLGSAAAFAVAGAPADPPVTGRFATVLYRTVTETRTVNRRLEHHTVGWWHARAVQNRRRLNAQRITLRRIRQHMQARWHPTVGYAIHLASSVFGVDEQKMRQVAYCESTMNPFADNGRYHGLFQLGWAPFGMSPYDPVANALSTAQTVVRDGSWRQWECG